MFCLNRPLQVIWERSFIFANFLTDVCTLYIYVKSDIKYQGPFMYDADFWATIVKC